jgi:cytochrome b subunit of formate dehydrogenase
MIEKSQTEKWLGVWKGLARVVPWIQGLYYIISGMWAQVSIDTFMMVTGPKTDIWLVKVVGLVLVVSGVVLILSTVRRCVPLEIAVLATGNAAVLAGVELVYVLNGTISPVYLLDALIEAGFILGWVLHDSRLTR